jgi:hypothetical protein
VALLWTFSITSMSPTFDGDHAASETQEFKYDHTANINLTSKSESDVNSLSSIVEEEVDIVVSASQRPQSNLT